MKNKILSGLLLAITLLILSACGSGEERCFVCTLNATTVDVCESTYQEQAARNNLEVSSLDEYINLIRPTGFSCIEQE